MLYTKYREQYQLAISNLPREDGTLKPQNPYLIKPEIWITMKYLEDNDCNPWDERFKELVEELKVMGEQDLLAAIATTLEIFNERVSDK